MRQARFLIFPSEWYEGFPLTIVEAFASGLTVIASNIGAMREIVKDGSTGLHFEAGNPADLAAKVKWAWGHESDVNSMGIAARASYTNFYSPERNYEMLMEIYERVLTEDGIE